MSTSVVEAATDAPPLALRVVDIGMVLTTPTGVRLLITDIVGVRLRVVRIPEGCAASDYGQRFRAKPTEGDPTAATLD